MRDFFQRAVSCPHCGKETDLIIDSTQGDQDYYEDCTACCNPMHVVVTRNELADKVEVRVDADDEQIF